MQTYAEHEKKQTKSISCLKDWLSSYTTNSFFGGITISIKSKQNPKMKNLGLEF